jgi:HD-GYP domain-containing protein (c-di-GMP phosphodiesterase class II)
MLDVQAELFDPEHTSEATRRQRAQVLFGRAESVVQDMWKRVRDRNSFDASTTQRIVHQLIDQIAQDESALIEFTALKEFDEYTYYHSVNVAIYSIAVGMRLGLDRERLTLLGMAALFHDIGKVKLPHDLITKPDEYDEEDWVQIRRHPALGALTLANMRPIDADVGVAMAGAFEHHLRLDMTGYPKLSRPRAIHLYSRIIALCDAFDAMTSGRVYQKDWTSPDEAIRRLVYKGREWYDPVVLKAFVHVLGIFPVGTVGRLSDGSVAVVICNNPDDPYSPEVTVVREPDGAPCIRSLTLARRDTHDGREGLYILAILDPKQEGISIGDYIASIPAAEESDVRVS